MKEKKCKVCGKVFSPSNSIQKVCSVNCAIEFAKKATVKESLTVQKQEKKAWEFRKSEMKEKIKTLSDYQNELQKEINKIIRLLDRGHGCISSGRNTGSKFDAGHLFSRGAFPSIRFNLHNIWSQSVHDNQYLSGNFNGFRTRLIEKFGASYFEYIEGLRAEYPSLKLSKEELVDAKLICKEINKQLQDEGYLTDQERLEYRYKLNKRIGIYEK
jgi:Bacteriophage Lambda NinG protein